MKINGLTWTLNEAPWDRALRIFVGLALLGLVFVGPETPWGYLGLVPLVSGVLGHSLVYELLGVSTVKLVESGPHSLRPST
jgi:DUF2892 family protein